MTPRDVLRLMGVGAFAGTAGRLYFGQPSSFMPDVELALRAGPGEARILPGPSSRVWRFTGELMKGPPHSLEVSMGMPQTSLPNGSVL